MAGCETSARGWCRAGKRGSPTSSLRAQWSSSLSAVYGDEAGGPFPSPAGRASGMSESSSSSTSFCDATARALSVVTSIPSCG